MSDERDTLAVWHLDTTLLAESLSGPTTRYNNAKVVLVGETGVGKTSLGMVLTHQPFDPRPSTTKRNVWILQNDTTQITPRISEEREVLLWDMAGQQGYRVVNQLSLDDVAVALLVFNSKAETDPLGGVYYWERALRQARKLQGAAARPQKRFLVAARTDAEGAGVSDERIQQVLRELDLDGFFATSALQGTGIEELRQAVLDAVVWDEMLKVTSSDLFQRIKQFLVQEKAAGRLLSTAEDLYRTFLAAGIVSAETRDLRRDFDICIERLAGSGLLQRLSWGSYVLLQPEMLDAYASALVNAARNEPDGLGSIRNDDALAGRFAIPQNLREQVASEIEKQLLLAMVEELIRRDLALVQDTDKGQYLVFPAQTTRERPEFPNPRGQVARYEFEGAVTNLYATLTVRLARSTIFGKPEIYRNAIQYTAATGGTCGLLLQNKGEGVASLTVFFSDDTPDATRVMFEEFIAKHLEAAISSRREPIFRCPNPACGLEIITPEIAARMRGRGETAATCRACGAEISIVESRERMKQSVPVSVAQMNADANRESELQAWILVRRATNNYDVFFSYNVADSEAVQTIADRLMENGVMPWLFERDGVKGHRFQPEIEKAIANPTSRAGVIFAGDNGIGKWQDEEIDALIAETKRRAGFEAIPAILPGTTREPNLGAFLRDRSWVDFRKTDPDPIQQLIRAITGLVIMYKDRS